MYIERTITKVIEKASKQFKVLLLTGARQVGKSTVLKRCAPDREYVTFDDITEREMAINEPKLFLQRHKAPIIIDEIQYAPNLLSYIKIEVDNSDKKGQYWLIGSQQFHMMKNVSESLAGRIAVIDLLGLSLSEINNRESKPFIPTLEYITEKRNNHYSYKIQDVFKQIYNGSYPALNNNEDNDRELFYQSYLRTYLERDIRDLSSISNEMTFLKFVRSVAARTGEVLQYSTLANEVGISQPTAKSWLSLLVSSRIVYLLEPYYINITKRMTKMPKIYFLDTGLCAYLTGWNTPEVIEKGAKAGAFFETFVISEIIKSYQHNGKNAPIFWYRDFDDKEIDLLIEQNGKLYPIEIKLSANPDKSMVKNFSLIKNAGEGGLICMYDKDIPLTKDINVIPINYL